MLGSLSHGNIATVHDFAQSAGRHFLVMELVEGETLADRLTRGVLPMDAALGVAGRLPRLSRQRIRRASFIGI